MAGEIQDWLVEKFSGVDGLGPSPIEAMFLAGMVLNARVLKLKGDENEYRFGMQEPVGPYRVDFVLEAFGAEVVIEVDGHDFHEKTKRQAAHDKRRDRFLTQHGYAVIHFTGSEVWANPFRCAEEAFAIARAVGLTRGGK